MGMPCMAMWWVSASCLPAGCPFRQRRLCFHISVLHCSPEPSGNPDNILVIGAFNNILYLWSRDCATSSLPVVQLGAISRPPGRHPCEKCGIFIFLLYRYFVYFLFVFDLESLLFSIHVGDSVVITAVRPPAGSLRYRKGPRVVPMWQCTGHFTIG